MSRSNKPPSKTKKAQLPAFDPSVEDVPSMSHLQKHSYLQGIISPDPDDPKRYVCDPCTSNQSLKRGKPQEIIGGYVYWLKKTSRNKAA